MKKELIKKIKEIIKEVRTSRADIEKAEIDSSIEDLSDLESSDISSEEDFFYADEEDDDYDDFYDNAKVGGVWDDYDDYEDDDFDRRAGESDQLERIGGLERFEEATLKEEHIKIIKRVIKNKLLKEDYYNLMGVPNANPVASNTNGTDATVTIDENPKEKYNPHLWPKDDDEGYEDEPGSRADEDDWKYRNVDLDEGFVKEDRIDHETGKGARGVQSQVAAKKKAMEKERAAEEKIWADQERISRAKRNKGL